MLKDTDKKKSKSDLCHSTGFCLTLLYTTESASSVSFFGYFTGNRYCIT